VALSSLYRRWRRRDRSASSAVCSARQSAYRQLWPLLEEIYWDARERKGSNSALRGKLREVNAALGEELPCFRPADLRLIGHYLLALRHLGVLVYPLPKGKSTATWEDTGAPTQQALSNLDSVTRQAVDLRNRLLSQIRGARPSDPRPSRHP
jgi:hypothetical protein